MSLEEELISLDQKHVWHPYAPLPNNVPCFPVDSACGAEMVVLANGQRKVIVDGMSSWWACIHGYNNPVLTEAMKEQIDCTSHVMFGGLTHKPAIALAQKLVEVTPDDLQHVFYSDSGSVSVEVAMKMALQYCYNLGHSNKNKFLTIRGGYHGDTFMAMSVCDPVNGMHHMFQGVLHSQLFVERPVVRFGKDDEFDPNIHLADFRQTLEHHVDEIAAVILEPIVQGAGGMYFYSQKYLCGIRALCDEYNVLLIADEIATGFGRTGQWWACQHANITPDILCMGKALSGGTMSFAATMTTTKVANVFNQGPAGVLMHGPTFMGNPLACAVSLASIKLLQQSNWKNKVKSIEDQLLSELEPCRDSPLVKDVRVLGAIGVIEMKESINMQKVQPALVHEFGVWLRPFGRLLYSMPPFNVIERNQLRRITKAMVSIATRKSW